MCDDQHNLVMVDKVDTLAEISLLMRGGLLVFQNCRFYNFFECSPTNLQQINQPSTSTRSWLNLHSITKIAQIYNFEIKVIKAHYSS